ncbi:MAG: DUF4260 domain-containing protein [Anaerolineae bacterium]|nr:DUF4260 domain-containing protein [Anaerolineae bacterium]
MPGLLLKLEGIVLFLAAVALYINQQGSALLFALLLFAPDLSMLGYLRNPQVGSVIYNAAHNYAVPGLLIALSLAAGVPLGVQIGLIWLAHIGMDRTMGYGLKYPTAFKDTHMQRV